jgi:thioredoxin reductase
LLMEREAIGGQAGSSSLIRNYVGFPRGTSGRGLANKAFAEVWSFGADIVVTWPVTGLHPVETGYLVRIADGSEVHSRSVVIATGVSYRRLEAPGLSALMGPASTTALWARKRVPWRDSRSSSPGRQLCRLGGGQSRPVRTSGDPRGTPRVGCRHDVPST